MVDARRKMSCVRVLAVAVLWLLALSPSASACGLTECNPVVRKLGRGLANSLFSIVELPSQMIAVGEHQGPLAGGTLGLLVGLSAVVTRTVVGLVEVATFPLPLPRVGYGPVVQPEFLLQPGS